MCIICFPKIREARLPETKKYKEINKTNKYKQTQTNNRKAPNSYTIDHRDVQPSLHEQYLQKSENQTNAEQCK
jgi:hypothetical protein